MNPNVGNFSVLHLQPKHPHTPNTHHEALLLSPRWTTFIQSASFDKSVLCVAFSANILRTLKKVFGINCGQKWAERYGEDQDGSDRTYFLENLLVESFCSHQPWDNISSFNLQQRRRNMCFWLLRQVSDIKNAFPEKFLLHEGKRSILIVQLRHPFF